MLATCPGGAAVSCPVPPGANVRLGEADGRARLDWIDARLGEATHSARLWAWGWGGFVTAGGVGSLVAVPFVAQENRVDYYTGAVTAAFGVIPFVIFPLSVLEDGPRLHRAAAEVEDARLCATLADGEAALVRGAFEEERQRAWWVHAGNVAFNTGVLLFLGLGYHHWTAGLINGGAGLAIGEAMIFTSPTRTIGDLDRYRGGMLPTDQKVGLRFGWTFRSF